MGDGMAGWAFPRLVKTRDSRTLSATAETMVRTIRSQSDICRTG